MFENLSYKTKFRALIVIACMLSVAAYRRSFYPLFQVVEEHHALSEKVREITQRTEGKRDLDKKLSLLDRLIGKQDVVPDQVQQDIISFVTQHASGRISVNKLAPVHAIQEGRYRIFSYQVELTGSFNDLLRLSYEFEKSFTDSKIVSMQFFVTRKNETC
ncbi:hypothetical protein [Flavobacterium sp. N1718]|uniref:hypothetical protein n=1 Tax=Flavobacterium sp. N1718 TaxID=2986822 RepID=UPI00222442CC|nr:hypothetical protein [Flavobacterium sp. N1718]